MLNNKRQISSQMKGTGDVGVLFEPFLLSSHEILVNPM